VALALNIHEIIIPMDQAGRADKLLARLLKEMPGWRLRAAFQRKDVKRNGKRIAPQDLLSPGDCVRVYSPFAAKTAIECLYQDSEYAVVHKMPGLPVQGPASVETIAAAQFGVTLKACHRLDVQTGGLLLLAKTDEALEKAAHAFFHRRVARTYRALVRGRPDPAQALLKAFLTKDADTSKVRVISYPAAGAMPIETEYRVIDPGDVMSRVEVDLHTGRTHQIRAHMAYIGHPVLGDDKYGDRAFNKAQGVRRQMLWAVKLTLWDGRSFSVREDF
jgi:23S rRNA pseudouridine955/2504/2580 synthase